MNALLDELRQRFTRLTKGVHEGKDRAKEQAHLRLTPRLKELAQTFDDKVAPKMECYPMCARVTLTYQAVMSELFCLKLFFAMQPLQMVRKRLLLTFGGLN